MTFQSLSDKMLKGANDFAAAHIDDIIIFSKTWEQHIDHIRDILIRIREANLTSNAAKCKWGQKSIKIVKHVLEKGLIKPDPEKINAILNYPIPNIKRNGPSPFRKRELLPFTVAPPREYCNSTDRANEKGSSRKNHLDRTGGHSSKTVKISFNFRTIFSTAEHR